MSTTTPFKLGVFVGGLSTDPTAEAAVAAQYARFTATLGATPSFMDAFIDQSKPITGWAADASYTAYSWQISGIATGTTPVIGLPMASSLDAGNQDAVFKAFAAGTYDSQLQGIVSAWKNAGFGTQYFRVGYEGNGDYVPWYAGSDAQTRADWVSAFQHISSVLRSVPGADVKIVWNPNLQAGNTLDVKSLYPGDSSVDVIAGDIYSPTFPRDLYDWRLNNGTYDSSFAQWFSDPVNRTHYWQYPAANQWQQVSDGQSNTFGLQDMIDFAKLHGKPIGIAETGAGGDGTRGPTDDPAFPQWLATALANSGANVAFVNIWDTNPGDGNWDFSSPSQPKPLEAAAWAKYFGAGATTASGASVASPLSVGSGPDQMQVMVSEDAYQGDAQFTISVDGSQIGGTLTAIAAHGAGASQVFSVNGSFGGGSHSVKVQFLNDAWGGPGLDRNLYLDGVVYGGGTTQTNAGLFSNGSVTVGVVGAATSAMAGPDNLVLSLSEDAYAGDALFSATVDGKLVVSGQAVTAKHGQASQSITINGSFGAGPHKVDVTFLNDSWGGPGLDRNLYIDDVSLNGVHATAPRGALYSNGTDEFTVPAPGTASDTVTFGLSEDAFMGDALATVSIDGQVLGGPFAVTSSHALGLSQKMSFTGNFGTGAHNIAVAFSNDAWGGAGNDRNLYLDTVDFDGSRVAGASASLYSNGTVNLPIPATVAATTSVITDPTYSTLSSNLVALYN
jgi:hypothetical protein